VPFLIFKEFLFGEEKRGRRNRQQYA